MGVRWPTGYAQASYVFTMDGIDGEAISTMGWKSDALDPVFNQGDVDNLFDEFVAQGLWALQASSVIFLEVRLTPGPSNAPLATLVSSGAAVPGGEGGDQLIPNTTPILKKTTALGGRKNRGRMYLPVLRDGHVGPDGLIDATPLGDLNTAIDDYVTAMNGHDMTAFLFHDSAEVPTEITGLVFESKVGTQRGRLR